LRAPDLNLRSWRACYHAWYRSPRCGLTNPNRMQTPTDNKPARTRQRRTTRDARPRSRRPRSVATGFVANTKGLRCVRTDLTTGKDTMRPGGLLKPEPMPSSVRQGSGCCPRRRTLWRFTWTMSALSMRCRGDEARSTSRGHLQCRLCRGQRHPRGVGCDRR
jgi:hypothetical protein